MTSSSRYPSGKQRFYPASRPRPYVEEKTLKSEQIQIERKTFVFMLRENPRGRFLRITEDAKGRHDTIIVPAVGIEDFKRALEGVVQSEAAAAAATVAAQAATPPPAAAV